MSVIDAVVPVSDSVVEYFIFVVVYILKPLKAKDEL